MLSCHLKWIQEISILGGIMKKKLLAAFSLLMMLTLVACGGGNSNGANSAEGDKKFEGVTLKALISYGDIEPAFEKFTEETGIKVEYTPMSTGAALAQLNAENGKIDADVWLGGGADAYVAAKDKGYLYKYEPKGAKDIDEMYKDPEGYWTAVSFQAAGIIVNNKVLEEKGLEAPKTWEDLTDPKYKDEIIFANPAISGTAYSLLETMYQNKGEEYTYDFLERLNENVAYCTEGGGEPAKKVCAGEFPIGFTPIGGGDYDLVNEYPVTIIEAEDLFPWIPSPVAIFESSEQKEAAQVFADYFTSKEGGEALQTAEARIMPRDDVSMPDNMKHLDKKKFPPVDMNKMAENRDKVLAKFLEIAGAKAPVKEETK